MYIQFQISSRTNNSKCPLSLWSPGPEQILSVASQQTITIYDAQGKVIKQQQVPSVVVDQVFTQDGKTCCYLLYQSNVIILYRAQLKDFTQLPLDSPDFTCIAINNSVKQPLIALGTQSGHIILYDIVNNNKQLFTSKHSKAIHSIQFSQQDNNIISLSQDEICITDPTNGLTKQQFKGNQFNIQFISPVISLKALGPQNQNYDTVVTVIKTSGSKKFQGLEVAGQYLLILNVSNYIMQNSQQNQQIITQYLQQQILGFAITKIPDTQIVDYSILDSSIVLLDINGNTHVLSLDHSRIDMNVTVINSKFAYGRVICERKPENIISNSQQSFIATYQEFQTLVGVQCPMNTLNSLHRIIRAPHSKIQFCTLLNYNVNKIDEQMNENVLINFTDDTLGQIKHQIVNIGLSSDQNVFTVSTTNGNLISVCFKVINKIFYNRTVNNNIQMLGIQNKPNSLQIDQICYKEYQQPEIRQISQNIELPIEIEQCDITTSGLAAFTQDKLVYGDFKVSEQNKLEIELKTQIQTGIKQICAIEIDSNVKTIPIILTNQQTVIAVYNNKQINLSLENQIVAINTAENIIFLLDNKGVLHCVVCEAKEFELLYNEVSSYQLSAQFASSDTKIGIFPSLTSLLIYKENQQCNPQIVLLMEETVINDIFGDQVIIGQVEYDSMLQNVFYVYLQNEVKNDVYFDKKIICSLNTTVADYKGPHVFYQPTEMAGIVGKDVQAGIMVYGIKIQCNNQNIEFVDTEPGLTNLAKLMIQISGLNNEDQNGQDEQKKIFNPLLPVEESQIENPLLNNIVIHGDLPKYKQYTPYINTLYEKATLELLGIYSLDCAVITALACNNLTLLDYIIKFALRICRIDIVKFVNEERIIRQGMNLPKNDVKLMYPVTAFQQVLNKNSLVNNPPALDKYVTQVLQNVENTKVLMGYICLFDNLSYESAQELFISSNKPNLALQLRLDTQQYKEAALLAKQISTPVVRTTIIIQQAQEDENKGLYSQAIEQIDKLEILQQQYDDSASQMDKNNYKYAYAINTRCKCQLAMYSQIKDQLLPEKQNDKYIIDFQSQKLLNKLFTCVELTKLVIECSDIIQQQKDYKTSAEFTEAAAYMSQRIFSSLQKELHAVKQATENVDLDKLQDISQSLAYLSKLMPEYIEQLQQNVKQALDAKKQQEEQFFTDADAVQTTTSPEAVIQVLQFNLPQSIHDLFSTIDYQQLNPNNLLSQAAQLYIKAKQPNEALKLIQYVKDVTTITDLAKTIMKDRPKEALELFQKVNNIPYQIQCYLLLNQVNEAEKIFKELRLNQQSNDDPVNKQLTIQASALLAEQFIKQQSNKKAVYYLVHAQKYNEAWKLAIQTQNEAIFIKSLTPDTPSELLKQFAKYYSKQQHLNLHYAATCLKLGKQYDIAIKLLLQQNTEDSINQALNLLQKSKSSVSYVLKFIQGGIDGVKKSPIYIIQLYCSIGRGNEAEEVSLKLVKRFLKEKQVNKALQIIVKSKQIILQNITQQNETYRPHLSQQFLHYENLVYSMVAGQFFNKHKKHMNAAVCLERASNFRNMFENPVQILIANFIESTKAGMQQQAHNAAKILIQEYNNEIPEKFKPQIENAIRKFKRSEVTAIKQIKCPICNNPQPLTSTKCSECGAILLLDADTGIFSNYLSECPYCQHLLTREGLYDCDSICLFCQHKVDANTVLVVTEENYNVVQNNQVDWSEYEVRPLVQFSGVTGQKRYQWWCQVYGDQVQSTNQQQQSDEDE